MGIPEYFFFGELFNSIISTLTGLKRLAFAKYVIKKTLKSIQ